MGIENRTTHRINIELPLSFKVHEAQKHLSIGMTQDISPTGMRVLSKDKLDVGREIQVQIRLPDDSSLTIHAKVVWCKEIYTLNAKEYIMGLQLMNDMRADEAKFVKFVARQFLATFTKKPNPPSS